MDNDAIKAACKKARTDELFKDWMSYLKPAVRKDRLVVNAGRTSEMYAADAIIVALGIGIISNRHQDELRRELLPQAKNLITSIRKTT